MGFKRLEWSLQTEEVREVARMAERKGFVLGLSSFGPTLYTLVGSNREGEELISTFGGEVVEPNNVGARVIWRGD
jgi:beta-ribofuranosylaminobenzene 5'-phosphate synthase